eukprot:TRINITY_DN8307_c0_g1_i1.p2 TRINITY_DN8307_c0_g1~~TRINITY_DN8307_c0_g1_i1.p2  ORF type:complete len:58 (+),score=2.03 TRINITY_DN8307_c0_g1_i1:365-538(+)
MTDPHLFHLAVAAVAAVGLLQESDHAINVVGGGGRRRDAMRINKPSISNFKYKILKP